MRRLLIICCASAFLDSIFFAALAPILPELKRDLALSGAATGVLAGSYAAGVLLIAMPGGWFAAKYGPRLTLLVGLVGMGVFSTIFGFAESLWLLDASRFLQGASGALMWVGAMSWVINAGPVERRGALVGTIVAAATVGELLGAPIGALAHAVGMELVFSTVGVISAILVAGALTLRDAQSDVLQTPRQALRAVRGSRLGVAVWLLGAAAFAFGVVSVMAPLHLDDLGAGAALIAAGFAIGSLVETILGPQIGHLSDRVGRVRPYQLGVAIGAVSVLGIAEFDTRLLVFASLVACAFAWGFAFTPSLALAADAASNARVDQGYAAGFTNLGWGGGQMLGALGGGALAANGYLLPALVTVGVLLSGGVLARRTVAQIP